MPNAVIGLSAVNPQYKEEDYILPLSTLPRQISTWSQDGSMSQQKPKKPFGDGSGPFGKPQKPFPQSVGLDGSSPWKGGGFSIEELMKPRTKVIPGKFALKKR